MLFSLALIPVVGLLLFIYFNDKKEKEPISLLIALFFAGMGTVITAFIAETIGQTIVELIFIVQLNNYMLSSIMVAVLVVGPAEELGKFLVLRLITWKNRNFNYSYDAIVYSVFVSLGFAALENVLYVFINGTDVALMRMFTAVPGHACFAVFMGYFYSKAKYASLTKSRKCALHIMLSMLIPIVLHGIYDAIIMGGASSGDEVMSGISLVLWIGFVIALFVVSIILIIRSSRHDFCIVSLPGDNQLVYRPEFVGTWTCSCGVINYLNYCSRCGNQRPMGNMWHCPVCGTLSTFNFCGHCGSPRPLNSNTLYR